MTNIGLDQNFFQKTPSEMFLFFLNSSHLFSPPPSPLLTQKKVENNNKEGISVKERNLKNKIFSSISFFFKNVYSNKLTNYIKNIDKVDGDKSIYSNAL